LCGTPVYNVHTLPHNAPKAQKVVNTSSAEIANSLLSMGFTSDEAQKASRATKTVAEAAEWIMAFRIGNEPARRSVGSSSSSYSASSSSRNNHQQAHALSPNAPLVERLEAFYKLVDEKGMTRNDMVSLCAYYQGGAEREEELNVR
jgi:hypothetical protein